MSFVLKLQAPFERLKLANSSPQVALCKAIILQSIIDASNTSSSETAKKLEKEAFDWLFTNSEHFSEICLGADLEVDFVRDIANKIINLHQNKANYSI